MRLAEQVEAGSGGFQQRSICTSLRGGGTTGWSVVRQGPLRRVAKSSPLLVRERIQLKSSIASVHISTPSFVAPKNIETDAQL